MKRLLKFIEIIENLNKNLVKFLY